MVTNGDGNVGQTWNNGVFTKHGKKSSRQWGHILIYPMVVHCVNKTTSAYN